MKTKKVQFGKRMLSTMLAVALLLGTWTVLPATVEAKRTFYSPNQLKLDLANESQASYVRSLCGNKLVYSKSYRKTTSRYTCLSPRKKKLTAKTSKKTKYFVAEDSRIVYGPEESVVPSVNRSKWLKKVSKSKFKKLLRSKRTNWDRVVVKKGKVKIVIIGSQWAE